MFSVLRVATLTGLLWCTLVPVPVQANQTPPPPNAVIDEAETLRQQIETARDAYQHLIARAAPPKAANADEVLEQEQLQGAILSSREHQLDAVQRLPAAIQRSAEQKVQAQEWSGFPAAPPYSIMLVDQLRKQLDGAQLKLQAAQARASLLDQQIADGEKSFKAADIAQRQSDEKATQASTEQQRERQAWLRDLAQLRGRAADAAMAEAHQLQKAAVVEADEVRQQIALLEKQLATARAAMQFSQADLDLVLADLDRQRTALEKRSAQTQSAGQRSQRAWTQAKLAVDAAKRQAGPQPPPSATSMTARIDMQERTLHVRRLQAENDQMAYDMARRMLDLNAWERAGWQNRWILTNTPNSEAAQEGLKKLDQMIQRLQSWDQYLQGESSRAQTAMDDDDAAIRQTSHGADSQDLDRQYRSALQTRLDIMRTSQTVVADLWRTLLIWRREVVAHNSDRSVAEIAHDGVSALRHAALALWNFELFSVEDSLRIDGRQVVAARSVTLGKSLGAILFLLLGYRLSTLVSGRISEFAVRRMGAVSGHAAMLARWLQVVLVTMLFISTLYMLNIPLTVFAFLGGALAIALGFGTQILLKNLVSGIMLLIERPLRVGDLIEVGSIIGRVTNIGIRSSTVRKSDGIEILVPNSSFIENNVTNWTYSSAKVRRSVTVGVDYATPATKTRDLLLSIVTRHGHVLSDPPPRVLLEDFGADALIFNIQYWIDYGGEADASLVASDLRFMIESGLSEAGINIPFPQRVIHIQPSRAQEPPPASPSAG